MNTIGSKLSTIRAWDKQEFQKASTVDRMYMHLMSPRRYELRFTERDYLKVLKQAYVIICNNPRKQEALKLIDDSLEHESDYSNLKIYRDACDLYGKFADINVKLERSLQRDRLFLLRQLEEEKENPDLFLLLEIEKQLTKVMRIDQPDEEEPESTELPPIIFSTDPTLLIAEDAEFEEMEESENLD
jgi:hypothetical protein